MEGHRQCAVLTGMQDPIGVVWHRSQVSATCITGIATISYLGGPPGSHGGVTAKFGNVGKDPRSHRSSLAPVPALWAYFQEMSPWRRLGSHGGVTSKVVNVKVDRGYHRSRMAPVPCVLALFKVALRSNFVALLYDAPRIWVTFGGSQLLPGVESRVAPMILNSCICMTYRLVMVKRVKEEFYI